MGRTRVPARREGVLKANSVFSVLDQGRLWASGTADREDAIPPCARSGSCRIQPSARRRRKRGTLHKKSRRSRENEALRYRLPINASVAARARTKISPSVGALQTRINRRIRRSPQSTAR